MLLDKRSIIAILFAQGHAKELCGLRQTLVVRRETEIPRKSDFVYE